MRISRVKIQNYRTLGDIELSFPHYYTAICGKNDAGKSNIIRVLRDAFQQADRFFIGQDVSISAKNDYTKWKEKEVPLKDRAIYIGFTVLVHRDDDIGLHRFLQDYLALSGPVMEQESVEVTLSIRYRGEDTMGEIGMSIDGQAYESLKAQEVLNRIETSGAVLFHDSTEFLHPFRFRQSIGLFREMSPTDAAKVKAARDSVGKALTQVAKREQQELTEMLGRLKEKYQIGVSIGNTETADVPYSITLGTGDGEVALEEWGSGTQNRTRILFTLFKAKRSRDSSASSAKIMPIIVIEEPESYLHPSAQAEFGATLRDLAEEFRVQVIVTTHSPYLLSVSEPQCNVLLQRKIVRNRFRETELVDTSGVQWAEPFSLALGLSGDDLAPWRSALFSASDSLILVEGETDKEYFELLLQEAHGNDRLRFDGIIFPYGGKDTLRQKQLLRFMKSRFKKFIVTYDLDAEKDVEPSLKEIGLQKGIDYIPIGKDAPAKNCIEGLLPDNVFQAVYGTRFDLVQRATSAVTAEARSAKFALKRALLDEFKKAALPRTESFRAFYGVTKQLNKMIG